MLGVADACTVFGQFAYCPFDPEKWFDSVERVDAGETMEQ
jgi:hypothetical protein